jgi:hypothetical protein
MPFDRITHYREFNFGEISGNVGLDKHGKPVDVIANHGSTRLSIAPVDGIPVLTINDAVDTNFVVGVSDKDLQMHRPATHYHIKGVNYDALRRSTLMFQTVGKYFLPQFGVNMIEAKTPNTRLARVLEKKVGAELHDYAPSDVEMAAYDEWAHGGFADRRFSGKDPWKRVVVRFKND